MGSLSFDNLYPSEADVREEESLHLGANNGKRSRAAHSAQPQDSGLAAGAGSDVSPWVTSPLRRTLDFTAALIALIVFLPLMALAAILVRLGSTGPVFFRQQRMGRNGKDFTLYKFRSMRDDDGSGCCITVSGDARITGVGSILRRYKLDELPQFWNVLRGDMGLVGPRPKLPHHEALHMACRPGITGVATLAFHREEEFLSAIPDHELEDFYELFVKPAKARLDLEYMEAATFSSDVGILWRTLCSCLFSSNLSPELPAEIIAHHAASSRRGPERVAVHAIPETSVHGAELSPEL